MASEGTGGRALSGHPIPPIAKLESTAPLGPAVLVQRHPVCPLSPPFSVLTPFGRPKRQTETNEERERLQKKRTLLISITLLLVRVPPPPPLPPHPLGHQTCRRRNCWGVSKGAGRPTGTGLFFLKNRHLHAAILFAFFDNLECKVWFPPPLGRARPCISDAAGTRSRARARTFGRCDRPVARWCFNCEV